MTIDNILGYSTIASSNTDVGGVSIVENCAAANLNNGIRAVMADLAKHVGDTSGKIITTGAPNGYVVATSRSIASYADGLMLTFRASFTNTGTSTINVDGRGGKFIKTLSGGDLPAGAIVAGGVYTIAYSAGTGWFYLLTPAVQTNFSGVVQPAQGGTGITSYQVGDLLCASAATTLGRLIDVATGNVLLSGGPSAVPAYGKVGLTTHVTGILPAANGGTGGVLPVLNGGTGASTASGVSLDNITGFSSPGILTRTAAGTYAFRTLVGITNETAILNGNGVSGNPSVGLAPILALRAKAVQVQDNNFNICDETDTTKLAAFQVSGVTTATLRTMTVPNASGTLALLETSGPYTVAQTISTATTGGLLTLASSDSGALVGPSAVLQRNSISPFANDLIGSVDFQGKDSAAATVTYGTVRGKIIDATSVSGIGAIEILTVEAGTPRVEAAVSKGMTIGTPTGGFKGLGTLNVSGDIYKNNSPYTNPDFVFESFYDGDIKTFAENRGAKAYKGLFPLDKLRDYTKENFRLPGIDSNEAGVFERTDIALEKIEELTLYILGLHDRISELEEKLNGDNK